MPSAAEILEEALRQKELLEKNWVLPWHEGKASASIWRHPFIHLLARLPDGLFEETMDRLLDQPSFALKGVALHLVRMRGKEAYSRHARELFLHRSVHVRCIAAAALGQFADPLALDSLLECKDGEHAEVKKAVVDAMKRIRDARCIPLLARWVGRVGEDDDLRRKACEALADIGDEAAMPVLVRVLDDSTAVDDVRGEAARAVGIIGGPDAPNLLLNGLANERPWVRARCAQGLGLLGDRTHLPRLLPLLQAGHPWMVRTHAIEAVARLGGAGALKHLLPLTADPEVRIRSESCAALSLIDHGDARRRLKEMLDDPEVAVQIQALDAYARVTGKDFGFRVEDHTGALDLKALQKALKAARAG